MARSSAARGTLGNETRAALSDEICPQPLGDYSSAILHLRQRHQMGEGPDPEGNKPTETNSTGFQNCKISSHYRHVASVGVPKWARFWTAVDQRRNESADVPALLDRDLSYAWQRSAALRGSGGIADHEYPRLVRYLQEWADADTTGMVCGDAERAQYRRGCNPRRPQYRCTLDPLAGDDHALRIDVLHSCSRHNRHAELFEPLGSFFG